MDVAAESIAVNFAEISRRIERAASRSGRRAGEITLVGVSKTFPADHLRKAHAAGVRHFGENRVQEWQSKESSLQDLEATWHFIGYLQNNKAARAARLFHCVDSVHSLDLARRLHDALAEVGEAAHGKRLRVLIEVRVAEEETKTGAHASDVVAIAEGIQRFSRLDLRGLMCIPPYFDEPERARPFFSKLRDIRNALAEKISNPLPVLSMGMSHDFEIAIEEGSTEVRVGTALFGARPGKDAKGAA
jgi:pyridoxal phosphate enzyme (YggS family)